MNLCQFVAGQTCFASRELKQMMLNKGCGTHLHNVQQEFLTISLLLVYFISIRLLFCCITQLLRSFSSFISTLLLSYFGNLRSFSSFISPVLSSYFGNHFESVTQAKIMMLSPPYCTAGMTFWCLFVPYIMLNALFTLQLLLHHSTKHFSCNTADCQGTMQTNYTWSYIFEDVLSIRHGLYQ